jgi:hypothetical protein
MFHRPLVIAPPVLLFLNLQLPQINVNNKIGIIPSTHSLYYRDPLLCDREYGSELGLVRARDACRSLWNLERFGSGGPTIISRRTTSLFTGAYRPARTSLGAPEPQKDHGWQWKASVDRLHGLAECELIRQVKLSLAAPS